MLLTSTQEYQRYNQLKKSLESMAGNHASLSRQGDLIEVRQDVRLEDGTVVGTGSHFDDDLSTLDTISISEGSGQKSYQHSGQRKWLGLLKTQVLQVQEQSGLSFNEGTFEKTSLFW